MQQKSTEFQAALLNLTPEDLTNPNYKDWVESWAKYVSTDSAAPGGDRPPHKPPTP